MSSPDAEVERWSALRVWLFSLLNRDPKSNRAAVDRAALRPRERFIDLGCGLGAALEYAAATGAEITGIDPSPAMVERAARRVPRAQVTVGSAEEIPFVDDRFDAALAVATYHHWADPDAGLAETRRVLAPGGRLLVVERHLRRSRGHGIDAAGADALAGAMTRHGFAATTVDTMKVGRRRYLVVTGVAPD